MQGRLHPIQPYLGVHHLLAAAAHSPYAAAHRAPLDPCGPQLQLQLTHWKLRHLLLRITDHTNCVPVEHTDCATSDQPVTVATIRCSHTYPPAHMQLHPPASALAAALTQCSTHSRTHPLQHTQLRSPTAAHTAALTRQCTSSCIISSCREAE